MFAGVSMRSERARRSRAALELELGGRCARCPETRALEFDCVVSKGDAHHLMPWPRRIRWYWLEHLAGNIQLLCRKCHNLKTARENAKVAVLFERVSLSVRWRALFGAGLAGVPAMQYFAVPAQLSPRP